MSYEENLENLEIYVTLRKEAFREDSVAFFEYLKVSYRKGIRFIFCDIVCVCLGGL